VERHGAITQWRLETHPGDCAGHCPLRKGGSLERLEWDAGDRGRPCNTMCISKAAFSIPGLILRGIMGIDE